MSSDSSRVWLLEMAPIVSGIAKLATSPTWEEGALGMLGILGVPALAPAGFLPLASLIESLMPGRLPRAFCGGTCSGVDCILLDGAAGLRISGMAC